MTTSLIWNLVAATMAAIITLSLQVAPSRGADCGCAQPVETHYRHDCGCGYPGRGFVSGGPRFSGSSGPYYLWHGGNAAWPMGGVPSANPYWPPLPGAPYVALPQLRPVLPPPGTLGMTYKRPSRPVPEEKHPRVGMLDVRAPAMAEVSVAGLDGYCGDDGVWHFESPQPLLPGIPHIYDVRALVERDGKLVEEVRVVRLIPGRIVDLAY